MIKKKLPTYLILYKNNSIDWNVEAEIAFDSKINKVPMKLPSFNLRGTRLCLLSSIINME
jgi:hypothetical protein